MKLTIEVARVLAIQLIEELEEDNPAPEELWFRRDSFDPTYGATELRAAAKRGWIELETDDDPHLWRFRLTPASRAALQAARDGA
ncbi:MAG: hypothetical protein HY371_04660 [Devosia nanyangense]|nr:hypothetical protein [Devosia nanyangense]